MREVDSAWQAADLGEALLSQVGCSSAVLVAFQVLQLPEVPVSSQPSQGLNQVAGLASVVRLS